MLRNGEVRMVLKPEVEEGRFEVVGDYYPQRYVWCEKNVRKRM